MAAKAVRVISFDASGTLFRVAGSVGKQYAAVVGSTLKRTFDMGKLDAAFVPSWKSLNARFPNFGYGLISSLQWWTMFVGSVFSGAGYDLSATELSASSSELYHHFGSGKGYEVVDDETRSTLQTLKARGFSLVTLSNFDDRLPGLLQALDLAQYFDRIVYSAGIGAEKPDPQLFRHVQLGFDSALPPHMFLHVGNHERKDYQGAISAGWQSFLLQEPATPITQMVPPEDVIAGTKELLDRLRLADLP